MHCLVHWIHVLPCVFDTRTALCVRYTYRLVCLIHILPCMFLIHGLPCVFLIHGLPYVLNSTCIALCIEYMYCFVCLIHVLPLCVCICSGGCGRTGTFITISILLERLKTEGVVDVFHTVRGLRLQRPKLVQSVVSWHILYCKKHHNHAIWSWEKIT